ncbi:Coiled-coil domain-containing protein 55 [Camponotus japonicus]
MAVNKQHGLLLPKKQQQKMTPKLGNVFGDDNASDEEDGTDWVRKALKAESEKNKVKKQTKLDMQRALNEDPTIYQYDEVYDNMERSKSQSDISKEKEKKPRYIQKLLKTAERRKKEQEHRIERMVQKEREAEGEMYADKESFVTSAYKAKLEEFKKMEEEEARMSRLEAIGDVTKQQDISGFYRHLYEQTVDYKSETNEDKNNKTKERNSEQKEEKNATNSTSEKRENTTPDKMANATDEVPKTIVKSKKSRQYRQRAIETYESDSETETSKEESKDQNIVSSMNKDTDKLEIHEPEEKKQKLDKNNINTDENMDVKNKDSNIKDLKIPQDSKKIDSENEVEKKSIEKKDRSSIWIKRTVGPLFEEALQRYYARKAKRLTVVN